MCSPGSADCSHKMLRLGILLFLATAAFGQTRQQTASIWIETAANGDLAARLTLPFGEPMEAFAGAIGCDVPPEESRFQARCPAAHPSKLTFHSTLRLCQLAPLFRQAGVDRVNVILMTPRFGFLRIVPALPPQSPSGRYYRAEYSLAQLPQEIAMEGGFEIRPVRTLAACTMGLMLTPFLLLLLRPSDLLRLRVQLEAIFVLGWTVWTWMLVRLGAGPLLSFVWGESTIGTLFTLLLPALVAVWIGSRVAAREHGRLTPQGSSTDHYGRGRFWTGAALACFGSTILNLLVSPVTNFVASLVVGLILTVGCVVRLRRLARGGSRPLSEGDLRKRVFELAAKAGVNLRGVSILTSQTPRPPLAFAARWGVIFLNEALLGRLSRREVDAVVCHELSHLRPSNRSGRTMLYVLVVVAILVTTWVPNFVDFAPFFVLAAYFWFKRWRRAGEYKADGNSVLWCGDPEAMITGLARVSQAHNQPLEWGAPVSWMTAHPPTMDRFRAIARAGRLGEGRLAELLEESRREAADHYMEAQDALIPEDAAFSPALRQQLRTRLSLFLLLAPGAWGCLAVWLLERLHLPWWAVVSVGSLLAMVAIYLCCERISARSRQEAKQRAVARYGPGVFAGFSPSAEPRLFDGAYHYDLGLVRFVNGMLEFAGDRARFTLDPAAVRRVGSLAALGTGRRGKLCTSNTGLLQKPAWPRFHCSPWRLGAGRSR